jgi:FkbM family methyltransferase
MRPGDKNINVGVGPQRGLMTFHIIRNAPELSTFSVQQVERLNRVGENVERTIEVEIVTVHDLLETHGGGECPDFITIDVEGDDLSILRSIDFNKYRPKIILAEINTHDRLVRFIDIDFLLFRSGYFHFGDTGGGHEGRNAIYIDKRYLNVVRALTVP